MLKTIGILSICGLAAIWASNPVIAATGKLLAGLDVADRGDCASVRIDFGYQVRYLSHTPAAQGDELRILLKPTDPAFDAREALTDVESLPPPNSPTAAIHAIELEIQPDQSALNIYFSRTMSYMLQPAEDQKSLTITVSNGPAGASCATKAELPKEEKGNTLVAAESAKSAVSRPSAEDPAVEIATARAALTAGQFDDSIRLLTKVLETAKGPPDREARELLGLAREKNKQLAHAEAEYRQYLIDFPGGADAARVQQRLDGVIAAENKPFDDLHKANLERQKQADDVAVAQARKQTLADISQGSRAPLPGVTIENGHTVSLPGPDAASKPKSGWTRSYDGSFGLYYFRDQGASDIIDRFNPANPATNIPRIYQDGLTAQLDLRGTISNSEFEGKGAVSVSKDRNFLDDSLDYNRVSQLYVEGNWKERGITERLGRQSRFAGGILGRFDGSLTSLELPQGQRINLTVGSPVDRTRDDPFLYGRYFYGLSYDFTLPFKGWDASVYGVEQQVKGTLDRRAIGYDLHFKNDSWLLFHTFDYDVNFRQLNTLIFSGSYILKDKSNVGFDFDYRKSPSLFASNALQGQQTDHLDELLGRYNYADVAQLAIDRSADTFAATLFYNREINEHLQFYGDIYESYMGATVASGGVDAMPAEGFGTYATAQLIGTSLLKENDLYVTGLRYAKNSSSNQYELELGAKYPLTAEWRISPATRFGYKTFGTDGHTEFHFLPSVGLSYAINRNQSLEFDAGTHLTERFLGAGTEHEWEATLTVGYRYDFYSAD